MMESNTMVWYVLLSVFFITMYRTATGRNECTCRYAAIRPFFSCGGAITIEFWW